VLPVARIFGRVVLFQEKVYLFKIENRMNIAFCMPVSRRVWGHAAQEIFKN